MIGSQQIGTDSVEVSKRSNWSYFDKWQTKDLGVIINAISCSSDGKYIAIAVGDVIEIRDPRTGRQVGFDLLGHTRSIVSIQYSPDNLQIVSGGQDSTVRIWSARQGKQIGDSLVGHSDCITSVLFLNISTIASASFDESIRIWDIETRSLVNSFYGISGINNIDYFPNKFLVTAHENFSICLWNIENRMLATKKINSHQATVFSVKLSLISKLIGSGSFDNSIKIWNTVTKKLVNRLNGQLSGVTAAISFSPDGWFLAFGSYGSIALWNISNRKYISLYGHITGHVSALQFSWDGKYLVSGINQTLKVQNIGNMTK